MADGRQEVELSTAELEYARASAAALADRPPPPEMDSLAHKLLGEFSQARLERRETELRWLKDLRQYKGQYEPDELAGIGPNRSKTFVRKTRVKIKTLDSRVADLLFPAGSDQNWTIEPTPKPTLTKEHRRQIARQVMASRAQAEQMGQQPAPVTREEIEKAASELAKEAAKNMATTIADQLTESRYKGACLQAIHSGHLYGTGILKGPLVERRVRTRFVFDGQKWSAEQEMFLAPFVEFVPVWRFYPDMQGSTMANIRFVYERHQMTAADMADLAARKSFNGAVIRAHVEANPDGHVSPVDIDDELKSIGDRDVTQAKTGGMFEVLERWGWLSGEQLRQAGAEVPVERRHESFFSNVWLLPTGQIIKAVLQPINGVTWPYHIYSFDQDETNIFAEGIAAIMRDDQSAVNAAARMILDNGAMTAGPMVEVNPNLLTSWEKLDEIRPWRIWVRNNTAPGQRAVQEINLSSNLQELRAIAQMFDVNADEVTAIPRYMTGENVTTGAAGTMGGMSMLMGAANIVIKDLINAWDEGVTQPFLESLYRWNMQFSRDLGIKGDFDVKARGAASLVAKEIRAQSLNNFAAMTANPLDAPYIKRDELNRQRAEALEMSGVVRTQEEVDQEMNSPQAQQAAQLQAAVQQLQLQDAQIKLLLQQAQAEKLAAETSRIKAEEALARIKAVDLKVGAVYAGMQAGGAVAVNPAVAPIGDEILRSAGWQDATPETTTADAAQGVPPPDDLQGTVNAPSAHTGMRAGIETVQPGDAP